MPHLVTLFEHQSRRYIDIPGFPLDQSRRDRLLDHLDRINQSAGVEILHIGRKQIHANALIGIVQVGDFTFQILPKIDANEIEKRSNRAVLPEDNRQSPSGIEPSVVRNFLVMLSYAYDIHLYEGETAGLAATSGSWVELLTRIFAVHLHQLIPSGLSTQYVTLAENLPALRGRWDIQRQIRHQGPAGHRFEVIYDTLSPDIPLNQVLKYTVQRLLRISQEIKTRRLLESINSWFAPITEVAEITPALISSIEFTRLNDRFQKVFNLAKLFLSGQVIQLSAGSIPAHTFFFDMNSLFEQFISAFLERHRPRVLPNGWQNAGFIRQSSGLALYLAHSGSQRTLRLRPDLMVTPKDAAVPYLIVDLKYKPIAQGRDGINPEPADIYQMLAYAVRTGCSRGLLLYPQPSGAHPSRRLLEIDPAGLKLYLATVNLRVPFDPPDTLVDELHEILTTIQQV